jgi:probable HAF family extracellular repeat protein
MAVLALAACQRDVPTEPTRLAPSRPELALTGGVGTPIFSLSFDGEPQPLGVAIGLNDAGQVTGGATGLSPNPGSEGNKPFRWTPGSGAEKLTSCCENGFGADINAAGAIVGSIEAGPNAAYRPLVATGATITFLPTLPGLSLDAQMEHAMALALNDALDVVGFSPTNTAVSHAVRWNASGAISDLGTLGGTNSRAVDINNAGQIVGTSQIAGDATTHAFLWSSGTGMQDLNTITGADITDVVEINDEGQIIGTYVAPGGQSHAFRYTPGSGLLDLGTLGGTSSAPTGLNGRGEVVGVSKDAGGVTHAFLWTPADGLEDVTTRTGLTDIRRLNDKLQTLTVTAPTTGAYPDYRLTSIPRLVQLQVTQSNVAPIALFTVECNGLTCVLDGSGSLDDKPGLTYAWSLGKYPGGTASGATVTVTYPHASQRTVTLTVTDANGLTSTRSQTFDVATSPIAAFTVSCTGLTCTFDATASTQGLGPSFAWEWRFGDGSTGFQVAAPTHTYAQPGTYAVRLEIVEYPITEHSGHAILTKYVTVAATTTNQPPVASFTYSCTSFTCVLDGTGSTDDHGIVSYAWNLDRYPNGAASGATTTAVYPHTGPRQVTLTVTDASGQTSSMTRQVDVGGTDVSPMASFTWSCTGLTCSLDASASSDDNGIVSYAWNLDKYPGGTASGAKVTATYPHSGTRNVTLTVTDSKGQTSSLRRTLVIP